MVRAYTTDGAPDEERFELRRQAERRQWFERIVMVPVSLGMIVATAGYAFDNIVPRLGGYLSTGVDRPAVGLAIASALAAAITFVASFVSWLRR